MSLRKKNGGNEKMKSDPKKIKRLYAKGLMKIFRDSIAEEIASGEKEFLNRNNLPSEGVLIYTSGHSP